MSSYISSIREGTAPCYWQCEWQAKVWYPRRLIGEMNCGEPGKLRCDGRTALAKVAFDLGLLDGSCFNLRHAVIPLFGYQREARRLVVVFIVGRVLQYRHADDLHFDEAP